MASAEVGPRHFKNAVDLREKLRFEKNPTKRAEIIAEAQLEATFALIAAVVESGLNDKQLHHWKTHGFKTWD
jgi:hypothetical protein